METHRLYSDRVMDHLARPRNVGSLDNNSPWVGTGIVGTPECGDVTRLQIQADASGRIVDAKYKTYGCGPAIAASSLAAEWLKGRTVQQAGDLHNRYIAEQLDLPQAKLHCSVLAEGAVKAAVEDWHRKRARRDDAGAGRPAPSADR